MSTCLFTTYSNLFILVLVQKKLLVVLDVGTAVSFKWLRSSLLGHLDGGPEACTYIVIVL